MADWLKDYDAVCPNCKAFRVVMVSTTWGECTNPYCRKPYAVMDIWTEDYHEVSH